MPSIVNGWCSIRSHTPASCSPLSNSRLGHVSLHRGCHLNRIYCVDRVVLYIIFQFNKSLPLSLQAGWLSVCWMLARWMPVEGKHKKYLCTQFYSEAIYDLCISNSMIVTNCLIRLLIYVYDSVQCFRLCTLRPSEWITRISCRSRNAFTRSYCSAVAASCWLLVSNKTGQSVSCSWVEMHHWRARA